MTHDPLGDMEEYESPITLSDVMLKVLMSLFVMWLAASMNTSSKTAESVVKKVEFIATVEWNRDRSDDLDCDVDLWVRDPSGDEVFYSNKEAAGMNIERDDLGKRNDVVSLEGGGTSTVDEDKEYWYLRAVTPGEYTINVHLYACAVGDKPSEVTYSSDSSIEVNLPVDVMLYKLNPKMVIVESKKLTLTRVWDEKTALNFTLSGTGEVVSTTEIPVKMIQTKVTSPQVTAP